MTRLLAVALLALLAACGADDPPVSVPGAERPNVLLIVVDDMAVSDLGSFGGEIPTPNLDRLAFDGVRFTNFISAPTCSPARAMMLTGVDAHRAGFGNMVEELAPNQEGKPGYEGYLVERVATLPALMRDAGYRTYMTGKWHLGSGVGKGPGYRGFERSFSLDASGASHFADMRSVIPLAADGRASYLEDGRQLERLPDDFRYSSEFYVDRMIEYLSDDAESGQPFFAYLSFTAPHWPLQAPYEAIAAQKGRYDAGYDALAEARLARQVEMGLVPPGTPRAARSPKERPWTSLDDDEQKTEIRAMEVYAAMVAEIDWHTGRLVDFLAKTGRLDNTAIIFLSDNGAEGHDLDETWPMEAFPDIRKAIDANHDFSYEAMGREGSYVLYGPNWANAGSPIFRLHKGFPTEGGTRVAAFIRHPASVSEPAIVDDLVYVTDLAPTILELAGIDHPGDVYQGRAIEPLSGHSFVGLIDGSGDAAPDRVLGMELFGKRAVREGRWKIVHMPAPWGSGDWQLYDVVADPGEARDLADRHPDVLASLISHWEDYARENNVIIPDWVSGY
jgi:arylsulfatase